MSIHEIINPLNSDWTTWSITILAAFFIGASKAGLKGLSMFVIPLFAHFYGGKASVGIILPCLLAGDLMALRFFYKSANIKLILKLIPPAVIGIIIAVFVGSKISDAQFKQTMGTAILVCVGLLLYNEFKGKVNISKSKIFSNGLGLSGGFATMIGNAAGPIFNLYLLSMRLPKAAYIGTGAWFYLLLNSFKVPFHIVSWQTINWQTLHLNLIMIPVLITGTFVGKKIVGYIPEKPYRYFIYTITLLSAIFLFFR
ncbi:sulfite exporter TauE/SafE family protein [Carboxylicivirga mesophila]|uniref:Probable membrane transporter protein n=1 Tax=Carboxylicivirga mesophila TaxID=1166478 RepID=A0ABS5KBZ9_9BACT|nr:sulfite exporter TauE/SafE family protein [Carboxylicivirga mesophila]MBS2212559.1 sulfite exporter TauE/SafE family protein [Carboxylicivirga mesophila]